LVEVTVVLPLFLVLVFGGIDFGFAFYQWNSAAKAVQIGARIAAVSDPVSTSLSGMANAITSSTFVPGTPWPSGTDPYTIICNGATSTCTCSGTCLGFAAGYSASAMAKIVYGRDTTTDTGGCGIASSYYYVGMCDIFGRITPANVVVTYTHTGLGYAGRLDGPVPTVTVTLQGLNFQFFFLAGLLGFSNVQIPGQSTTVTGESLTSACQGC
jgi:hypothetical protein